MTTYGEFEPPVWNPLEILRAELAWYPGRIAIVARTVLACTIVLLLAEVFRIPGAALGVSFPLLISRDNPNAARKSAIQIAMACSIATAAAIIGGMATAGSPLLHVLWVATSLLAAFYAISRLNHSNPALTASVVTAVAIQVWDYPVTAEVRVEHTLYTLLSIVIACVVSGLIETIFTKIHSPDAVLEGIGGRLALVEALLLQTEEATFPSPSLAVQLSRSAAKGVDALSELLTHSGYDPAFRDSLMTVIALTRQLTELGSNLAESSPNLAPEDRERCRTIAQNIFSVRSCLTCENLPNWIDLPLARHSSNPLVVEIERTVDLISQSYSEGLSLHQLSASPNPGFAVPAPAPDRARDREHLKFAVRGSLSSLVCYLFYMCTGWIGLGASIITCTLTARRFTGASRHRQSLRFMGFILGAGVIGVGTEILVLPQLDTLPQFAILFAAVVWLGSWVATSGPRIAFSGFQIVLAYNLVTLNRFTINTSLVPARDQVLGIMLGVAAMWLVFDHLWAETSGTPIRTLFLATLRNLGDFTTMKRGATRDGAHQFVTAMSSRINRDFDKLRDLADMYVFESFPKKSHESLVNLSVRTLLPELRAFLLIKTGLQQHIYLSAASDNTLFQEVEECTSNVFHRLAKAIEQETPADLLPWNVDTQRLRTKVEMEERKANDGADRERYLEMRLCASLLEISSHLEWRTRLNCEFETGAVRGVGDRITENLPEAGARISGAN